MNILYNITKLFKKDDSSESEESENDDNNITENLSSENDDDITENLSDEDDNCEEYIYLLVIDNIITHYFDDKSLLDNEIVRLLQPYKYPILSINDNTIKIYERGYGYIINYDKLIKTIQYIKVYKHPN